MNKWRICDVTFFIWWKRTYSSLSQLMNSASQSCRLSQLNTDVSRCVIIEIWLKEQILWRRRWPGWQVSSVISFSIPELCLHACEEAKWKNACIYWNIWDLVRRLCETVLHSWGDIFLNANVILLCVSVLSNLFCQTMCTTLNLTGKNNINH